MTHIQCGGQLFASLHVQTCLVFRAQQARICSQRLLRPNLISLTPSYRGTLLVVNPKFSEDIRESRVYEDSLIVYHQG